MKDRLVIVVICSLSKNSSTQAIDLPLSNPSSWQPQKRSKI